jgi:hypothetical protein
VSRITVGGSVTQANATNVSVINQNTKTETVVTPAKNSMPRTNKAASNIIKSSHDKNTQKRTSQPNGIQRSVTKQDLSSSKKDDSRFVKSIESRADSQPAKKTHTLTKQDSSVYLKGNSLDKVLKRSQRTANSTSVDARGKSAVSTGAKSTNVN